MGVQTRKRNFATAVFGALLAAVSLPALADCEKDGPAMVEKYVRSWVVDEGRAPDAACSVTPGEMERKRGKFHYLAKWSCPHGSKDFTVVLMQDDVGNCRVLYLKSK